MSSDMLQSTYEAMSVPMQLHSSFDSPNLEERRNIPPKADTNTFDLAKMESRWACEPSGAFKTPWHCAGAVEPESDFRRDDGQHSPRMLKRLARKQP